MPVTGIDVPDGYPVMQSIEDKTIFQSPICIHCGCKDWASRQARAPLASALCGHGMYVSISIYLHIPICIYIYLYIYIYTCIYI